MWMKMKVVTVVWTYLGVLVRSVPFHRRKEPKLIVSQIRKILKYRWSPIETDPKN